MHDSCTGGHLAASRGIDAFVVVPYTSYIFAFSSSHCRDTPFSWELSRDRSAPVVFRKKLQYLVVLKQMASSSGAPLEVFIVALPYQAAVLTEARLQYIFKYSEVFDHNAWFSKVG